MRVEIGDAVLYCGDCREVLPTLGEFDALITDPPYAIENQFGTQQTTHKGGTRTMQFEWDGPEAKQVVAKGIDLSLDHLKPKGAAFVFCGLDTVEVIQSAFRRHGLTPKAFAWAKLCPPPPAPGTWWPSAFELAIYGYRRGAWFGDLDNISRRNWLVEDSYRHGQPGKVDHPTQKPLKLLKYLVRSMVPPGGVLLDSFAGSGTTGVAAVETGRKATLVEISPTYTSLIRKRLEEANGVGSLFDPTAAPTMFPLAGMGGDE